jgi:TetR/AcrR family transcriptional regulator of autoinduction and epiphytic fitness
MLDSADVTPLDGRIARSQRTRIAIVDALIALLQEGNVQPTVEEVALRAHVAPRTVFQHYPDREVLFAAVSERRQGRLDVLMGHIPESGTLDERLDALVEQRARVYEWIAPVRRAALLMEPFSQSVHAALDYFRAVKRADVLRVFSAELLRRPEAERRPIEAALAAVTSYSTWDELRTQQGLDVDQASAALRVSVRALVAGC